MPDKNEMPLVSIIITSFNRSRYIGQAIDSSLAQDYPNFEVVISDNASTDGTDELMAKYSHDPRIKYYKNEVNIGMIPNFRKATEELAKGDYLTYISSDDFLINSSFLTEAMTLIRERENVVTVLSQNQTLNALTNTLKADMPAALFAQKYKKGIDVFMSIPEKGGFGWGGAIYNREIFNSFHIFDYTGITSLDFLVNNFLMLKGDIAFISKPTYVWRLHGNQASQRNTAAATINNFGYITEPARYALENNIMDKAKLEKWKEDIVLHEAKYYSLRYMAINKNEYKAFLQLLRDKFDTVYKKLKGDIKWNIQAFFFSRPAFSIPFFKYFSKGHHQYLSEIIKRAQQ
jgi:glycosyltransferase involved in cell wall biosynthesis